MQTRLTRRAVLGGLLATPALVLPLPALARGGHSIVGVDVVARSIVWQRIRYDMPGRIRWRMGRLARGGGRPVRVLVTLHTIDPFETRSPRRGVAVRYRVTDANTGRTLWRSRFLQRAGDKEHLVIPLHPKTRDRQERELADRVARQIAREVG